MKLSVLDVQIIHANNRSEHFERNINDELLIFIYSLLTLFKVYSMSNSMYLLFMTVVPL